MTVFHSKKNGIAIPRLPPPLRKTGKVLKLFPGRHTNNNLLLRRPTRYPLPFQIRSINSGLIFESPSSPSSPSSSASSSPLSSTEIITQLLHHLHLQGDKPGLEITREIARLSLYDLPSSHSPPANKSGNNNTTATTSYLDVPSSLPPPANKHSSSNSTTPTPFLDFLNRHQQSTEPIFDRGEKHKDYITIPEEYLFHPHAPMRYKDQFFDQCYPDSSMYGIHMILTKFDHEADKYNIKGYNKLPLTSDFKTYRNVIKETPKGYDPEIFHNFLREPPHAGSGRPQHSLKLKVGLPIMLLKKVGGVCAGTRLIVEKLEEHVITAKEAVAVGGHGGERGERVIRIRRQEYKESTGVEPLIRYTRQQFPVKRAFALAVNDVPEGVMFEGLGLDLKYDMVSPGQLHSALSRCRDPSRLKVYLPKKASANGTAGQYSCNVL